MSTTINRLTIGFGTLFPTQYPGQFIATRGMPKETDAPHLRGLSDLIIRDKSCFKQKASYQ